MKHLKNFIGDKITEIYEVTYSSGQPFSIILSFEKSKYHMYFGIEEDGETIFINTIPALNDLLNIATLTPINDPFIVDKCIVDDIIVAMKGEDTLGNSYTLSDLKKAGILVKVGERYLIYYNNGDESFFQVLSKLEANEHMTYIEQLDYVWTNMY